MIPLTVPEITRLLTAQPARMGHAEHWANWRRRHQARSRWYHQRTRLARDTAITLVSQPAAAPSGQGSPEQLSRRSLRAVHTKGPDRPCPMPSR
jgi:hypothetical protein